MWILVAILIALVLLYKRVLLKLLFCDLGNVQNFKPPAKWIYRMITFPIRLIMPVEERGLTRSMEMILNKQGNDSTQIIFVANHNIVGMDIPLLMEVIYERTGLFPRALCHRLYWKVPLIKQFFQYFGSILGDREHCREAMKAKQPILVFPGGGHEFCKSVHAEKYSLIWGNRKGFAELALEYNYCIVPVSIVGPEDVFSIWFDLPPCIAKCYDLISGDSPIGHGITVIKPTIKPQKIYFHFGDPIYASDGLDSMRIRDETAKMIRRGINELLNYRDTDEQRFFKWCNF